MRTAAEHEQAQEGAARLDEVRYRVAAALGRCQAYADQRDLLTGRLVLSIRGAFAAGATLDELHVETGLTVKTLRAVVRGATLADTPTPGFGRSAAGSRVTTDQARSVA